MPPVCCCFLTSPPSHTMSPNRPQICCYSFQADWWPPATWLLCCSGVLAICLCWSNGSCFKGFSWFHGKSRVRLDDQGGSPDRSGSNFDNSTRLFCWSIPSSTTWSKSEPSDCHDPAAIWYHLLPISTSFFILLSPVLSISVLSLMRIETSFVAFCRVCLGRSFSSYIIYCFFDCVYHNMRTYGEYKVIGNKLGSGAFG